MRPFVCAALMAAMFAATAAPVAAQEPTPTPTPTPDPAAQAQACTDWPASQKKVSLPFSIGPLRAKAKLTIVNGLLTVTVDVKGKLPRPMKKLTLTGRLMHRPLSELDFTKFKSFRGKDKVDVGKRKIRWTFTSESWCIPLPERTEIWRLELHAKLSAVRMTARNDPWKAFPVVRPGPAS